MKSLREDSFTLALSSGFFGFYAHVGFVKALEELKLKPSAYTGSSAGAIVGAACARGMSIKDIEALTLSISRDLFWDPSIGLGFLRGKKLQNIIAKEIGNDFNQLQAPLRISVYDIATFSTKVIDSGDLARAVRASCAVPLMFHPVRIGRRLFWDGGVRDKMAIHGLPVKEKILSHYLLSQKQTPHSIYEVGRDDRAIHARGGNMIKIQLADLPKSGPFAMDRGPAIIEAAYQASMAKLSIYG